MHVRALAHPSPYKIPEQWRTRVNSLGELNDDASHAVTAVLNSRSAFAQYAGDRDWSDVVTS